MTTSVTSAAVATTTVSVAPVSTSAVTIASVSASSTTATFLAIPVAPSVALPASRTQFEQPFVVVDQLGNFVRQLERQGLESGRFRAMHDHALGWLVQAGHQFLANDHFGNDGVNDLSLQLERFTEGDHRDG